MGFNLLAGLFGRAGAVNKGLGIIDQMVTDKDKANELKAAFYLTELQTTTIPVVDALHKMGRQFLAIVQVVFYGWCVSKGVEITPELVAGVSGATGIYQIAKGRGR